MKNIIKIIVSIIAFFALSFSVSAQVLPEPLKPARLVNDFVGLLSKQQNNEIERMLVELDKSTSTQIVVAIVPTIDQMDIAQYTTELAHKWGVGTKGKDNGIMVVIKPQQTRRDKGQVYISVGYGLEGAVPDITAKRIIRNEMLPQFEKGRYFEGIYSCVNTIKGLVAGEYTADEYNKKETQGNYFGIIIFVVIGLFFVIIGAKAYTGSVDLANDDNSARANRIRKVNTVSSALLSFFQVMLIMGMGRRSNGFDSFSGGSGDFGGFGGGSFGGGGAGGEW